MKRCPFCAEEIPDGAVVCRHCGRQLSAAPPLVTARWGIGALLGGLALGFLSWLLR